MLGLLSQRVLSVLQLTRMALVFTAIADSQCELLLWARSNAAPGQSILEYLDLHRIAAMVIVSAGLYGFGMSLNDIIDRRRDRQVAAHRPLPSGRIGVIAAHVICVLLALAALLAGGYYMTRLPHGWLSLLLVIWTGLLIGFYDYAGKYLVAPGLLSLGLIRFFHALIPAPGIPLLWHPLLLLNHVTLLSTVAYLWEEKRPSLTRLHWWTVLGGLAGVDLLAIAAVWWRRRSAGGFSQALWMDSGLLVPIAAAGLFVLLAVLIYRYSSSRRQAGQTLMLYGLLWLIVYDASFAAGYVNWLAGGALLLLLPVAYLSVRLMRWWSWLVAVSQRPAFKRAGR